MPRTWAVALQVGHGTVAGARVRGGAGARRVASGSLAVGAEVCASTQVRVGSVCRAGSLGLAASARVALRAAVRQVVVGAQLSNGEKAARVRHWLGLRQVQAHPYRAERRLAQGTQTRFSPGQAVLVVNAVRASRAGGLSHSRDALEHLAARGAGIDGAGSIRARFALRWAICGTSACGKARVAKQGAPCPRHAM